MKLVIVESPGKLKKISQILGPGWEVQASVGHVRDLPEKEMGVEAPDYRPIYVPTTRGKTVLANLRKAVSRADEVYLATDMDREGEAIAWHLKEALKLKNPKRIVFSEITEKAIKAAIANPGRIDVRRVAAQEGRRVLDRLVGYRVSPTLTNVAKRRGLSAGRVQSPAVRIVVDRERAIEAFDSINHFGARWELDGWFADWEVKPFLDKGSKYLLNRALAEQVANSTEATVIAYEQREEQKPPSAPFTTSTFQQAASSRLKIKPKAAMLAAQKLYQQGHITYMRTDFPNLSEDAFNAIKDYAKKNNLPIVEQQRTWKAKGNAQEAHEAIRPSNIELLEAGEDRDQKRLYKLIWQRAVASQMQPAKYAVRSIRLRAGELLNGRPVECIARGRTEVFAGWKAVYGESVASKNKDQEEVNNPVPELKEGHVITVTKGRVLEKKTKPPFRFTEAQLIKELEKQGIGRPSTYASIMDNIMSKGYVEYDTTGKNLLPTAVGYLVVDCLVQGQFAFIELGYTKAIEAQLDHIAEGKVGYRGVIAALDEGLSNEINNLVNIKINITIEPTHPCPDCGHEMTKRPGKGKSKPWWGCTDYPRCKTTRPDARGKPSKAKASAKTVKREVSDIPCSECGGELIRRHKKGKNGFDFFGCINYPKCSGKANSKNAG